MSSFVFFMMAGAIPFFLVLSSKVNDGLIIKLGFICMALGFFGAAGAVYDNCDLLNPCITAVIGFFIVMFGIAWKICSSRFKRITDWLHIDKQHRATERRVN